MADSTDAAREFIENGGLQKEAVTAERDRILKAITDRKVAINGLTEDSLYGRGYENALDEIAAIVRNQEGK